MRLEVQTLALITGKPVNDNMRSVVAGLEAYGVQAGLDQPHRLAHYLAQLLHESAAFHYDREIASGAAYEGREDLGNTQPGDGVKFKGRTPGQITGRANVTAFRDWCRAQGLNPPDFVDNPDLLNTDPWEGIGFIWYWMVGNPTRKSLNRFADANDIEMVTKRVNGGLNGFPDRVKWYVKAALVLAGYGPNDIRSFQTAAQAAGLLPADTKDVKQVDGDAGPKTRAALHMTLVAMATKPVEAAAPSPVVVETPVVPEGAEKVGVQRTGGLIALLSPFFAWLGSAFVGLNQTGVFILLGIGLVGVVILLWRGEMIAARAKSVLNSFKGIDA